MKKLIAVFSLFFMVLFFLSSPSAAQGEKEIKNKSSKKLSDKDKKVIIEIFNTLAPDDYYLEINTTKIPEKYGAKKVEWTDLQLLKDNHPTLPALWHAYGNIPELGVSYLIKIDSKAQTKLTLDEILGKANASKLQAVFTKYTGGSD